MSRLVTKAIMLVRQNINGFEHQTDIDRVNDMMFRLHQAGEPLNSIAIEEWAIETGCPRLWAKKLGDAAFYAANGRLPSFEPGWSADILDRLRAQLDEPGA